MTELQAARDKAHKLVYLLAAFITGAARSHCERDGQCPI